MADKTVYKKKLITLLAIIAVLVLIYSTSLIIDAVRAGARSSMYVWLDSADRADRITIRNDTFDIELSKINNRWFVLHNGQEYPARQLRIEDFLGIFTERAAWPVRYTNAASHARLGLDTNTASRVTIYAGNSVILDVLIGLDSTITNEIFIRRFGQNEVRSGNHFVASYVDSTVNSWYNLRLIPESETLSVDSVQRLSVYSPDQQQVFSRRNREWVISGIEVMNPDQNNIENYIRTILHLEGEDFIAEVSPNDPMFDYGRFVLELGTGRIVSIRFSALFETTSRRLAHVSGTDYVFLLPAWSSQWIFRTPSDFEMR